MNLNAYIDTLLDGYGDHWTDDPGLRAQFNVLAEQKCTTKDPLVRMEIDRRLKNLRAKAQLAKA